MPTKAIKFSKKYFLIISLSAFFGGLLNGFLGAAGGIFLGLVLSRLFRDEAGFDRRNLFASIQVAMIFISAVSLFLYSRGRTIDFNRFTWLILPAILGGTVGSLLLRKISSRTIGIIFALLTIYSGIKMLAD